ncbi:sodium:alanine symporter family protein [Enterobacteriaceae bacterium H20N1]|uniref:Sodium:alanine symporter family protein n=1 Tax=Dryocola boscaweniae TaxID=2925397 RepID=A0A9X2W6B3_9ENTR|nr:sodium:alanine symporter family protein [Dryocola boscaweniae]MCT4701858.1 sodium:alanine symporter family protein [Dryocola boscaweniae]MCT4719026.1 sodium:alanine symporter family protein [Dryocola boscaweniae]
MTDFLHFINDVLWGSVLIYLLIGAGIWFTFRCGFVQFRYFTQFRALISPPSSRDKAGISPFQALCTSLAARVGSGNIAGVALALTMGGPGAIFWMWVVALIGMATAFAECSLAQLYKRRDSEGNYRGGPAWYMESGLGMRWMGVMFSLFLMLAFGLIFNAVQANSIANALNHAFAVPKTWSGILLAVLTAGVIWGGMRGTARLAQFLVPFMAIIWVMMSVYVVALHIDRVPDVIMLVIKSAFGWQEAASGALAFTLSQAITTGFQRSMFSNEAGMGSTPNAAAAASAWPPHPASQGLLQMFGVFIDTVIICTATAAIVLLSGILDNPTTSTDGIALVQIALSGMVGGWASGFIAFIVFLFAFTSIVANYAYAENNLLFLQQKNPFTLVLFRSLALVMVMFGTLSPLPLVWQLADVAMAFMAITNLSAILLLSPVVRDITADYLRQQKLGVTPVFDPNRFPEIKNQLAPGVWDNLNVTKTRR